jgi:hypothetical protein
MKQEVCVSRIRLGQLRGTSVGKYTPGTRRIKVQEDRPTEDVRSTVRHELCHALQFQHDLDLSGPEWALALPIDVPEDERAGETWAYTCQQGPEPAYLMGDRCPGDPFGTQIFERVRAEFLPPSGALERAVLFDEVGRIPVGEEAAWVPTQGGGLWVDSGDGDVEVVDLRTGLPAAPAPPLDGSADTGAARLLYYTAFAANGARGLRLVYEDGDGVSRAGCLRPEETPFAADGELWSVYRDGAELVWGLWSVP